MSPTIKYTLARLGLFVVVLLALLPWDFDILLKMMIALLVSAALSYFVLRRWRDEISEQVAGAVERRRTQRDRLHSALAGEEASPAGSKPAAERKPAAES